jgi:hypothetical protein
MNLFIICRTSPARELEIYMQQCHLHGRGMRLALKFGGHRRVLGHAAAVAALALLSGTAWATDPNSPNFDIALIPDTQEYTVRPDWNVGFTDQMNWVVNNSTAKNIAYTIGLGDIVQDGVPLGPSNNSAPYETIITQAPNGNLTASQMQLLTGHAGPYTNDQYMTEWHTGDNAYKILDNAGVPYYAGSGKV